MGTEGKIKVDEHYPTDVDEPPLYHIKKIESIRSNVKFEQCYESDKLIGDGKFGKVYQVREKATGIEFAAKVIRIKQQADRQEVEREVSILTQLRHPRIAQIYDAFYTANNEVVLVMEIVRGGELFDRVADENYVLTELAVVMIICQLCEAIDYIHEQNILHLDIKPENIMCVSQSGNRIKLIDFGLARYYDGTQELRYMAGTPEFAAPEVIKYEQLDYHTDMWSVGVITYILLSGYSPFLGENICETYCNVEKGEWNFTEEFDMVSLEAKDFISNLIVYKKEKRMLPKECLSHPWIARHRAKVHNDAILERPADGPIMNNKQIMRYNAQRKLRRVVIYVRFLIEMNRLRGTVKDRMSQSGKKYFEPLLKMAEHNAQKVTLGSLTAGTSKDAPVRPQQMASNIDKERTVEKQLPIDAVEAKRKEPSTNSRKITPSSSPENRVGTAVSHKPNAASVKKISGASATEDQNKLESEKHQNAKCRSARAPDRDISVEESTSNSTRRIEENSAAKRNDTSSLRSRSITPDTTRIRGKKPQIPEVIVSESLDNKQSSPAKDSSAKSSTTVKSSLKKQDSDSVLFPSAETCLKKKPLSSSADVIPIASKSTERSELRTECVERSSSLKKKTALADSNSAKPPRLVSPVEHKTLTKTSKPPSKPRVLGAASSIDDVLNVVEPKEKSNGVKSDSLTARKSSAPEVIVNVTTNQNVSAAATTGPPTKATPSRVQRFGSSESSDSTKENRTVDVKKPLKQGDLKKKENPLENRVPISTILPAVSTPAQSHSLQKSSPISTLLRKRSSLDCTHTNSSKLNETISISTQGKAGQGIVVDKKVDPKPGSIQERLQKLTCNAGLILNADSRKPDEPKRGKVLPITTECKTTTTTTTSTSTKTTRANLEKKMQHVSDGKTVAQITVQKAESLDKPSTTMVVKKNVSSQDSLRSTAVKERSEEHVNKGISKNTRSALTKAVDKVIVEESSQVDGKPKKTSLAGSTNVTRKVVEKSEVNLDALGKSLKTTELEATEKMKVSLELERNTRKGSIKKSTTTKTSANMPNSSSDLEAKHDVDVSSVRKKPATKFTAKKTANATVAVDAELETNLGREKLKVGVAAPRIEFAKDLSKAETSSKASSAKNAGTTGIPAIVTKATTVTVGKANDSTKTMKKWSTMESETSAEFVRKEDFSFDALKEKLTQRLSSDVAKEEPPKKDCISIPTISSVRDRLRKFEDSSSYESCGCNCEIVP
ncbi:hypothetical protein Q1695_001673 [Nippostrongylus brasiliensis]|nr:hypothetical protein Q1695_001673 [Nippostrongylus brasiliensis]